MSKLPWETAQFEFGVQGADFIGHLGVVLLQSAQSQFEAYVADSKGPVGTLPSEAAVPQDFDLIGTEFHRWVRDHQDRLGLTASAEFSRFIERDFVFYSRWYERLRRATEARTSDLECVYYNAEHNFTLQYPVLLAALPSRTTRFQRCASSA